jgi:glycosyltransferase involved in cell wall biosynthesis
VRIAWVSPLPPSPSGVGDYSADLLGEVARLAPTAAFTTDTDWRPAGLAPEVAGRLEIRSHTELEGALAADPELVPVYHQANNPWHTFVYELAIRRPGVLVLHDIVLHHLLLDRSERMKDWPAYQALLTEQYGQDQAAEVYALRRAKAATELEKFVLPLSGPLARRSDLVVVHSRHGRSIVRMEAPDAQVRIIPHHCGRPPAAMPLTGAEVRARLGLPPEAVLIGSFGYITFPKQGEVLLDAFSELVRGGDEAYLVFVGGDQRGGEMLRQARKRGVGDHVRFAGYLPRDEFYAYLGAVDISVALRYPSAGETSGTLSRALALGTCVVAVRYGSFAEIPPSACFHVPLHGDTAGALAAGLRRLVSSPGLRRTIGNAAARHAAANLSVEGRARQYVEVARAGLAMRTLRDEGRVPTPRNGAHWTTKQRAVKN